MRQVGSQPSTAHERVSRVLARERCGWGRDGNPGGAVRGKTGYIARNGYCSYYGVYRSCPDGRDEAGAHRPSHVGVSQPPGIRPGPATLPKGSYAVGVVVAR